MESGFRFKHEVLLGIFLLLALGVLALGVLYLGGEGGGGRLRVGCRLPSVAGLQEGNAVVIAGVVVGRVESISVEGNAARLWLRLDPRAGVRRNAAVRMRARNLLGEKVIEILPRTEDSPLVEEGDELLGMDGMTEPDELFSALKPIADGVTPMLPELRQGLTELVALLGSLNGALKENPQAVGRLIDRTQAVLEQLAGTLRQTDAFLSQAGGTLSRADRFLADHEAGLGRTVERMDALSALAAEKAPPLFEGATRTLGHLDTAVQAVPTDTLSRLPALYEKLAAVLDALLPILERLERNGARIEGILKNLDILLEKVVKIDELTVRRFLQEEGINVNLTQDAGSKRRIEELEAEKERARRGTGAE